MHCTLTGLVGAELRSRDDVRAGHVVDFLVEEKSWMLRYVVACLDDARDEPTLLPAAALPSLESARGPLTACLTPEELVHGRALGAEPERITRADEAALHDALHWASYWPATHAFEPPGLHAAGAAIGGRLTCAGEPFGRIDDLLLDSRAWRVTALRVSMRALTMRRVCLPVSFVARTEWSAARFDSDVRAALLACAPQPGDHPEPDWLERLHAHFERDRRAP